MTEQKRGARSGPSARSIVLWGAGSVAVVLLLAYGASLYAEARETRRVISLKAMPRSFLGWEEAVGRLGGPNKAARRLSLYLRLPDRFAPYKVVAIRLLYYCGRPAVPALLDAVSHPDGEVRCWAVMKLDALRPEPGRVVPAFIEALCDEDARVRQHAAQALGHIGPAAASAVPALAGVLKDQDATVRWNARDALRKVRAEGGTPSP